MQPLQCNPSAGASSVGAVSAIITQERRLRQQQYRSLCRVLTDPRQWALPKLAPWLRLIPPEMAPFLAAPNTLRRYYAAVRLPAAVHVGLIAHRFHPPIRQHGAADGNRVSRFSRVKFPYMRGVCDSAVPVTRSRLRVPHVAFRLL